MSVLTQIASSQFYLGETADFGMVKGYIDGVIHKMNRCFSHVRELKDVPEKGSYISKLHMHWEISLSKLMQTLQIGARINQTEIKS